MQRGLTLLETLVAVAILAIGVTALQRLVVRSVTTVAADGDATRSMVLARALLTEAELVPPEPGRTDGTRSGGLRFQRDVERTAHPALREVRIRVTTPGGASCELVELVRVPPA